MKQVFCRLLTIIGLCSTAQAQTDLKLPRQESDSTIKAKPHLTLVLTSSDKLYEYTTDLDSGRELLLQENTVNKLLAAAKKLHGDSLFVAIKPSQTSSASAVVDVLDWLQKGGVRSYAIAPLTTAEKVKFSIKDFGIVPEPVNIVTPKSVTTSDAPISSSEIRLQFLFETASLIRSTLFTNQDTLLAKKVSASNKKELESILQQAINAGQSTKKKLAVIIQGSNAITYNDFKTLIQALRTKQIYNFQLVTSPQ